MQNSNRTNVQCIFAERVCDTGTLQEENVNGMELRVGAGNEFQGTFGQPTEDDKLNVIWVVDSNNLPFYRVGVW